MEMAMLGNSLFGKVVSAARFLARNGFHIMEPIEWNTMVTAATGAAVAVHAAVAAARVLAEVLAVHEVRAAA